MTSRPTCDFCGTRIDITSSDALIATIHRSVSDWEWDETDGDFVTGGVDTFRFCSQAHLAEQMAAKPLPAVDLDEDDEGGGLGCLVTALLGGLLVTALMIGALYGLFLLFQSWT